MQVCWEVSWSWVNTFGLFLLTHQPIVSPFWEVLKRWFVLTTFQLHNLFTVKDITYSCVLYASFSEMFVQVAPLRAAFAPSIWFWYQHLMQQLEVTNWCQDWEASTDIIWNNKCFPTIKYLLHSLQHLWHGQLSRRSVYWVSLFLTIFLLTKSSLKTRKAIAGSVVVPIRNMLTEKSLSENILTKSARQTRWSQRKVICGSALCSSCLQVCKVVVRSHGSLPVWSTDTDHDQTSLFTQQFKIRSNFHGHNFSGRSN